MQPLSNAASGTSANARKGRRKNATKRDAFIARRPKWLRPSRAVLRRHSTPPKPARDARRAPPPDRATIREGWGLRSGGNRAELHRARRVLERAAGAAPN